MNDFNDRLLAVLRAVHNGDFSQHLEGAGNGTEGEIAATVNELVDRLNAVSSEFMRISRELGDEGRFGGQAEIPGATGAWSAMAGDLNRMAASLTDQVRDFSYTTKERLEGTSTRTVTVNANGETQELKERLNAFIDRHQPSVK